MSSRKQKELPHPQGSLGADRIHRFTCQCSPPGPGLSPFWYHQEWFSEHSRMLQPRPQKILHFTSKNMKHNKVYINHLVCVCVCVCLCVCAQSCWTLLDPMNCEPPGSSVHEISQARILEWVAVPFSSGSSGMEPASPASHADSLPTEPPVKPQLFLVPSN